MTQRRKDNPEGTAQPAAADVPDASIRLVTCPQCGGDSAYAVSNPYRPFCSQRCKNIDLGAWAAESFRVPDHPDHPDPNVQSLDDPTHLQ